jgi:hypothetical protein
MIDEDFAKNVFINCPYDKSYWDLLLPAIFTVKYLGYQPQRALDEGNAANSRIDNIVCLVNRSKFGIHDLSRMLSSNEHEHARMNMPFEFGIDYGCQKLKGGRWSEKQLLVLDKESHRYDRSISDFSGSDIVKHNNDQETLIRAIRDWFGKVESKLFCGGKRIWLHYNDFQTYLFDVVVDQEGHKSVEHIPITEITLHMTEWLKKQL